MTMTLDSDNEFGYDFSAEEEELLFQLASKKDGLVAPPSNEKLSAIDAVPGRTDSLLGHDVAAEIRSTATPDMEHLQSAQTSNRNLYRGQAFHLREASSGLPTPPTGSSVEDVCYPDCTW